VISGYRVSFSMATDDASQTGTISGNSMSGQSTWRVDFGRAVRRRRSAGELGRRPDPGHGCRSSAVARCQGRPAHRIDGRGDHRLLGQRLGEGRQKQTGHREVA
jgi:hypothetical protein